MSIGKSSIARAVNATANAKTQNTNAENVITKFALENIGVLSVATTNNIENIKSSISNHGVLCPVLVASTPKGDIWLLDGYRRYYAAKELNMAQISALVISVENKAEANRIYNELSKLKPVIKADNNLHEEKFRVLCVKDHDLPTYLL